MDRRVVRTKKAIINAYFSLLREKGNTNISISEIARRADIDRKTFYLHYGSVDDVLDECVTEKIADLKKKIDGMTRTWTEIDPEEILKYAENEYKKERDFLKDISGSKAYDGFWERVRKILSENIFITEDDRAEMSKAERKIYIDFHVTGTLSVFRGWLRGDYDISRKELAEIVRRVSAHIPSKN